MNTETLFIKRSEVRALLTLPECIEAMGQAFTMQALGQTLKPALMHVDADGGEFHIKGGGLRLERTYFALKANGGFFNNRAQFDLPNILGLILLCDGSNGRPLAVMDSIDITILRTGATAALAAKYLARPDSSMINHLWMWKPGTDPVTGYAAGAARDPPGLCLGCQRCCCQQLRGSDDIRVASERASGGRGRRSGASQ